MRARNVIREVFTRLAGLTAMRRRRSAFVCGDCEVLQNSVHRPHSSGCPGPYFLMWHPP